MTAAERGPLRVVGRYALYNEIAAGGMATVHIGRLLGPVGFARTVAVKRLHPQFAKDPEFVSMFLDEARLAARVQHPNVVATIDVVATDGELFLIMDYVRGESLSKLLRTVRKAGERMPPRIAASICCGFLHGLHAAHEAKNERGDRIDLVHRDVSPQNVLVGADGIARVLDFGIAKAAGRMQVTRDGQIKGKLAYMPPEQLSGKSLTRAVDIYAGAVVLWETLTGERLFKGDTESETLAKILYDDVPAPSSVVPSLTKAFDAPLLRALSRDASKRHATARELAFELEKCVGIASGSEVGEWVENIVGPLLRRAREPGRGDREQLVTASGVALGASGVRLGQRLERVHSTGQRAREHADRHRLPERQAGDRRSPHRAPDADRTGGSVRRHERAGDRRRPRERRRHGLEAHQNADHRHDELAGRQAAADPRVCARAPRAARARGRRPARPRPDEATAGTAGSASAMASASAAPVLAPSSTSTVPSFRRPSRRSPNPRLRRPARRRRRRPRAPRRRTSPPSRPSPSPSRRRP